VRGGVLGIVCTVVGVWGSSRMESDLLLVCLSEEAQNDNHFSNLNSTLDDAKSILNTSPNLDVGVDGVANTL
jgi:hypothetical protein